MKRIVLLLLVALSFYQAGFSKEPKRPESYNYQRGTELIEDDQLDEGIKFLKKEISQNPKNGYAYAWMASAYKQKHEKGSALHLAEKALKNLPKSDKYYIAWTHGLKGSVYLEMADTAQALACFTQAIKTEPDNEDWYEHRGMLYRELKQWDKSDADFRQYIKLTPGLIRGNFFLGRNLFLQEKYEEALSQYQYAHKLAERSFTYSAMAEVEAKLGKYEDAANHVIEALKLESGEETALDLFLTCKDDEFRSLVMTQIKVQLLKNPNSIDWHLYQVILYHVQKQYEQAIAACMKIRTIESNPYFDHYLSKLYLDYGDFRHALQYINAAIDADSAQTDYYELRADIYVELDSLDKALADINYLIQQNPDEAAYYFTRADHYYFYMSDFEKAIEDYTIGLALDNETQQCRYKRGRIYEAIGEKDKALKDYQRVEENAKNKQILMFVKASLGKTDEAIHIADSLLSADTIDYEHRYNVACVYALSGNAERAMTLLEDELKDGWIRFMHLRHDPDLVSLHGDEFEAMILKYENQVKEKILKANPDQATASAEQRIVEVPFSAANGVTKVDCTINNLPLNFVFDTGASDVTISQVEANFMFKNGYLTDKDIIGKQSYRTADGNISVGTTINLRQINFGGLELQNVRASVVKSQNAPLLLGQSVLQRLGKIEIDNEQRVLKITTK